MVEKAHYNCEAGGNVSNITCVVLLALLFTARGYSGEPNDSTRTFVLGEIVVVAEPGRSGGPFRQTILGRSELERHNRLDASHALDLLPGLTLSAVGARNESMVYLRGFDLRQVPVFLDGIPEYVPFDGYVDLGRFTTFDLSEITVSRGFSSVLYGANALGGAINLVSRKPSAPFEYDLAGGIMTSAGRNVSLNVGTKQDIYYATGGYSLLEQDTYPLSSSFRRTSTEDGGDRDNSYRKDAKYSFKVGLTPRGDDEYAFTFSDQRGAKGNPVYAGYDARNQPRYWQWPDWDKISEYLITRTRIGVSGSPVVVKMRVFHDKFINSLFSYDDASYATQLKKSSFRSYYDDDTWGALAEAGTKILADHTLTLALHYKEDVHREHNTGEALRTMSDATVSAGAEDVWRAAGDLSLIAGASYDTRRSLRADNYDPQTGGVTDFPANDTHAWNLQAGAILDLSALRQVSFSVARKTRFATMKDRYSYRLGTALPNPDLLPEHAVNYDIAYREILAGPGMYRVSLFYSDIRDVIQRVDNVAGNLFQLRNFGAARYYGAELEVRERFGPRSGAECGYSFLHRENLSNPDVLFTDTPVHKVFVEAILSPLPGLDVTASLEYNSARCSTSDGADAAGAFALSSAQASLEASRYMLVVCGVGNIFDRNYQLVEGYPEPGRNYYATVRFHD